MIDEETKDHREALKAKVKLYERIIEHAPLSIFVKDKNKRNILSNKKDREILNHAKNEIYGKSNADIFSGKTLKKIEEIDNKVLETGEIITIEENLVINGEEREFIATRGPIYDEEGNIDGIFGVSQEITEYKKIERLHEQQNQLDNTNTAILGLSHDINNIVFSISTQAELLLEQTEDTRSKEQIQKIIDTAQLASDLFENFELVNSKDIEIVRLESIEINEVIEKLRKLLNLDNYSELSITIEKDQRLPKKKIDEKHFMQICMNIIINAIDSIESDGTLSIRTKLLDFTTDHKPVKYLGLGDDQYIAIEIIDTGRGIPSENISKILNPYFSTKEVNNSGLGLFIAYNLIRRYEGELVISTELGHGSNFEIILPVDK